MLGQGSFGVVRLARRVGGSVLDTRGLIEAQLQAGGEEGAAIEALQAGGKVVPMPTLLRLAAGAMGTMPAPFILLDFPRRPEHLARLEKRVGAVAACLELPGPTDRNVKPLLLKLRPQRSMQRALYSNPILLQDLKKRGIEDIL